jgi:hypothetical protein
MIIIKTSAAATYGGSGMAVYGGLTANEWAAFGGLAIAFVGLIANVVMTWHFKSAHLKIAQQAAKADEDE